MHPGQAVLTLLAHPRQVAGGYRAGNRPGTPSARVFQRPMGEVGVERADRHQDRRRILAPLADPLTAVPNLAEALLPAAGHLIGKVQ